MALNCFIYPFQAEHFPFLGANTGGQYTDMRCRTTFYVALGRLLIVDLGENEEKFEQFMLPLSGCNLWLDVWKMRLIAD